MELFCNVHNPHFYEHLFTIMLAHANALAVFCVFPVNMTNESLRTAQFSRTKPSWDYNYKLVFFTGDSLTIHNGHYFSTHDQDNDVHSPNCAQVYKGGWWYYACYSANLNGQYKRGEYRGTVNGVVWLAWRGYSYSLKFTQMMLRPWDYTKYVYLFSAF